MDQHRLAMIVGQYKSGSTWLLNLLSRHPDIRGISETTVFGLCHRIADREERTNALFGSTEWSGRRWRSQLSYRLAMRFGPLVRRRARLSASERPAIALDMPHRIRRQLKKNLLKCTSDTEYCRTLFETLGTWAVPSGYLLEKSPRHIRHIPEICTTFPNAKLISIHRDGRDVAVSAKFFEPTHGFDHSFEEAVSIWKRNIERETAHAKTYDMHVFSYESLLSDGPNTVTRILEYLDLPRDPETVTRMLQRSSFQFMTGRRAGQENSKHMFRKGVAGDWRNHFTEDQLKIFSAIAGDTLVELGYESDPDWRTWEPPAKAPPT